MRLRAIKTLKDEYKKGKFYEGMEYEDGVLLIKGASVKIIADDGVEKWASKDHFSIEE